MDFNFKVPWELTVENLELDLQIHKQLQVIMRQFREMMRIRVR